jgi:hypothetical protein
LSTWSGTRLVSSSRSGREHGDDCGGLAWHSFVLSFLESLPEVSAKLREPVAMDRRFEDVVKSVEEASVLVLVY